MQKVQIIDAIMGSGKTYDAIERMKKSKGNFVYVTPFLDEVERIRSEVPNTYEPNVTTIYNTVTGDKETYYKRDNLLNMANNGLNIVTTHSLFSTLHRDNYSYFKEYDLILDEVLTPIEILNMKADDIKIAFNEGLLVSNAQTGEVTYTGEDYNGYFYAELKKYCATSNVIYLNDRLLVWAFPPEIFKNFKTITVQTYLFKGSLLSAYFDYYNIPYENSKYSKLCEQVKKAKIKKLLIIYEGVVNNIGNYPTAFSKNWLSNRTNAEFKSIEKSVSNLIQRKFKTEARFNAFTTFKIFSSKLKGKGYSNGFIAVNERATNKYSDTKSMFYLANRYLDPNMIDFFKCGNVKVDEEQWALAELLQWIWRGRIRKDEPMNLFIPSKRMRNLLKDWLDN